MCIRDREKADLDTSLFYLIAYAFFDGETVLPEQIYAPKNLDHESALIFLHLVSRLSILYISTKKPYRQYFYNKNKKSIFDAFARKP
jgi:hypothetical protein